MNIHPPYPVMDSKEGSVDGINKHAMHNMVAAARAYNSDPVFAQKAPGYWSITPASWMR